MSPPTRGSYRKAATSLSLRSTTKFDRPAHFQDAMLEGAFHTLKHDHFFEEREGQTVMRDRFEFVAPLASFSLRSASAFRAGVVPAFVGLWRRTAPAFRCALDRGADFAGRVTRAVRSRTTLTFAAAPASRRRVLRDLHAFGHVHVFRRPSLLRIWEPLREQPSAHAEFSG